MGKNYSKGNYSKGNSGKRKESDFYETHAQLTRRFIDLTAYMWDTSKTICDPCAGKDAIVNVLEEFYPNGVMKHDINTDGVNFLTDFTPVDYIITNPPYSLANEFILHAKEVVNYQFAMLLPITYLQGSWRYNNIWNDKEFQLHSVSVFNRFPLLGEPLRADEKFSTGMSCYGWYLWVKDHKGAPTIHWIDIDDCILKKGDK